MTKAIPPALSTAMSVWRDAQIIVIKGTTAAEFLQGYLTCDTQRIDPLGAVPMAICNVKGRVLASGWAIGLTIGSPLGLDDEAIGLIVHRSLTETVVKFLNPYVTFSKCSLATADDFSLNVTAEQSGFELLPDLYVSIKPKPVDEGKDASADVQDKLITNSFAFVSAEISERFLPQMLGLDQQGAVDFDKGCYLGQEIVARAKFRGAVKRGLASFDWRADSTATEPQTQPVTGQDWQGKGTVIDVSQNGSGLIMVKTKSD